MRKTAILLFVLAILGARSIVAGDSYSAVTFTGSPKTNINAGSIVLSNVTAGSVLKVDSNKKVQAASLSDIETALSKDVLTKDEIDTQAEFEAKLFTLPSGGGSVSVNGSEVETPDFADSATLTWGVVGSTISATVANLTAAALATDSVSADELNAAGVETELEGVLDLQDLQGAVTDAQVPDNITVDLATTATTANAGDSATAFFSSGEIEDARLPSALARDAEVAAGYQPLDADLTTIAAFGSTGIPARTGDGTWALRTITAGNGMSLADGNGVSGNPTVTWAPSLWTSSTMTIGDSSQSSLAITFGLSGATDPTITAGNNSVTFSTAISTSSGNITSYGGSPGAGFLLNTGLGIASRLRITSSSDGAVSIVNNAGTSGAAVTAGTLTLTPASADTTALSGTGYSVTGSGATTGYNFTGTWNTSGNVNGAVFNFTNTASGSSSRIVDFQLNGSSVGYVRRDGFLFSSVGFGSANYYTGSLNNWLNVSPGGDAITFVASTSVQFGSDAASPVNQTLKAHDGSGTDKDGADLINAGGQGTGTGRGGLYGIQTSPSGSTGSSANAYSMRAAWIPKAVTLTESTATTVATIAVPSAKFVGGSCTVTVFASDATDHQSRTLTFPFSAINKAGTVTAGLGTPVEGVAVSSGTLTATITTVANGNAIDIKVDATSSLTQTTLSATVSIPAINSNDTASVTEI